jgi:hypothetical protein
MKRLIDVVAFGLLASISFTACNDSAPAGPSESEAVGVWVATVTGQENGMDLTQTLRLTVNSDETFSFAMDINGTPMALESGTWVVTQGVFIGTPSTCQVINNETGNLETATCGVEAAVRLPMSGLSGNTWTAVLGEVTLTFTKQ